MMKFLILHVEKKIAFMFVIIDFGIWFKMVRVKVVPVLN